jgi:30S ribosomal protein S31
LQKSIKGKTLRRLAFLLLLLPFNNNITMGRGDIRTKKGKTFAGSFGKARPAKSKSAVKANAAKKAAKK